MILHPSDHALLSQSEHPVPVGHWSQSPSRPRPSPYCEKPHPLISLRSGFLLPAVPVEQINDHLNQLEKFTQISANELYKYKIKPNFWHFFIKPLHKFINHYIYHAGFLDGYEGFQISMISAYGVFLKYAKLRELYKTNK